MPVVVRTRPYDSEFYTEIGDSDWSEISDQDLATEAAIARRDLGF
jgi:hypothetical protein